ncbi:hypothetical protein, partial [Schlesneria sp.]|uniref:hypothetical protein n=1 Tax=Schlesneria sp. TaxID=2762018 RepID=UPI002F2065A0
ESFFAMIHLNAAARFLSQTIASRYDDEAPGASYPILPIRRRVRAGPGVSHGRPTDMGNEFRGAADHEMALSRTGVLAVFD